MNDGQSSGKLPSGRLLLLARAARAAGRRQRVNAALRRLARLLPIPLAYAALGLGFIKWVSPSAGVRELIGYGFLAACLVPVSGVLASLFSRRPSHAGALALDSHHGSADRITNALAFSDLPPVERSPFMEAAIADALHAVERPSPARAVPVRLPPGAWVSVALALFVGLVSQIQSRPAPDAAPLPAALPIIDPVALGADDVAFLREAVAELAQSQSSPELTRAVSQFNELVEDIAERRLDRRELFRRLAEIERSLTAGSEADAALEAGLKELAEQLQKSPLSRPIAEALKEQRLEDADEALKQLANRLKSKEKVDAAELERLRKALDAASSQASGRVERLERARREAEAQQRRLLQKKGKQEAATPEQLAEQEKQKRKLERLDRDLSDAKQAREELSQLDRELAKAAQELMRELGKSAEHLQAGAEDINRMARKKMSQKEKQELKRQLEELKELLRQGGPGKEQHQRRLQQFAERARGKKGKPGEGGKQGQPGGPGGQPRLTLGPDGKPIPIPMPGQGSPAAGGERPGNGDGETGGREAGSGGGRDVQGPATDLDGKTEDVTAAAVDTGQGAASSEVVFGAAERGFTGSRYQKVYTQYRTVAEDVLEQDTIPAGYEFYVRRYFQLIRPREAP